MPPFACSNLPTAALQSAGEGAARMAEKLRFEEVLRKRGAIYRHPGRFAARACQMQSARRPLFTRAALARDQNRSASRSRQFDGAMHLPHLPAFADEQAFPIFRVCEWRHCASLGEESANSALALVFVGRRSLSWARDFR